MGLILTHGAASWQTLAAAGATLLGTLIVAWLAAHLMSVTERRLAARPGARALDAADATRLRFVRRLVLAVIVAVGLFLALLQFDAFGRLAGAALASSAVLSAIIGFAARESLSNMISGVTLAVTQPVRVGDHVEIADIAGTVEDVTLTYTWLRTADQGRVIVPNQILTSAPIRNDSIREHHVAPSVTVWIAPDGDEAAALRALLEVEGAAEASVDEVSPEGVRLRVAGPPEAAARRAVTEARLRAGALRAIREAGIPRPGEQAR
ncbi:MAG: mechanosensitive ion channel family protein [Solirubrobacteraceae bacterium]|nr:mechanosensitive ion channel family protein [Solirubrobacteraceae bacterium]